MIKQLVLATGNKNKVEEIKALLPDTFQVLGLEEIGFDEEIEETAATIAGNSLLKAEAVRNFMSRRQIKGAVVADDSGLEVEALGGRPGVHSARYAGKNASATENNDKLLQRMENSDNRRARFVTVITIIEGERAHVFEGEIRGTIALKPAGSNGFGYDPLFIPSGHKKTFAEFAPEEKNRISHRAKAVKKLVEYLVAEG